MRISRIPPLVAILFLCLVPAINVQAQDFSEEEIATSVDLRSLDTPPKPVKQEAGRVPPDLKNLQASVQVGFLIDERGNVVKPRIIKSSNDRFNEVAIKCVEDWRFEPGKRDGQPVVVRVVVPMRFK